MSPSLQARLGQVLSGLAIAFLLFDAGIKFSSAAPVSESFTQLGYAVELAPAIGLLELACVGLYALPRTALLGAILLTGLFGGAIASHVRVANPLFSHTFFSLYLSVFVWGGLYLREPRLHALVPLRR